MPGMLFGLNVSTQADTGSEPVAAASKAERTGVPRLRIRVRSPRDKVDGLAEAIRILRGVWSQPSFTFQGRLYRTDAAELEPKPDHPIPIWLGTYASAPWP
jgi:alkanesulfonate monooxygenase SsuD/methylene tetrahydromethanopterin reductase-like flavin-dependent oxidoreductase (luciferase family)